MNAIDRLDQAAYEMYNSLMVICKDPDISNFLSHQDPQALKQCRDSLQVYLHRNDRAWMAERYEMQQDLAHNL